jgi:hypothetical protein
MFKSDQFSSEKELIRPNLLGELFWRVDKSLFFPTSVYMERLRGCHFPIKKFLKNLEKNSELTQPYIEQSTIQNSKIKQ